MRSAMAGPSPNAVLQLIAGMQAVENLRAQNAAAAQNLAAQLQRLNAQAQARDLVAQRRLAAVQAVARSQASAQSPVAAAVAAAAAAAAAAAGKAAPAVLTLPAGGLVPPPPPAGTRPLAQGGLPMESQKLEEEEDDVPRCHLHRKQNKACKFCKAFYQSQELRSKKIEEQRSAALERLKEGTVANTGKGLGQNDKSPLPNLPSFPQVMLDRIQKNDFYNTTVSNSTVNDVKGIIASNEACDTEARGEKSLDLEPSAFICCVYRILTLQLTEGQLKSLLNSRSCWIRCAGFLYVRLGMHHERYWELLSDALMDTEEFVPFPGRGGEIMSVGQYVEHLLTKDKYCDLGLPRIPVAQRKIINKRMVLYGQFRRRYTANLEVLDRFQEPGVEVEICGADGEWTPAQTVEVPSPGRQCKTLLVRLAGGDEREVSLGMLICPGSSFNPAGASDLTRSRGRSAEELLEKYEAQQRDAAVASGKDYCKTSGQHTLRVGGVPFVAGVKRKDLETERPIDSDDEARREKKSGPSLEHQVKMAAIESKYCARVGTWQGRSDHKDNMDGPERMRLG